MNDQVLAACACGRRACPIAPENDCLSGRSLAMVYSPCQEFEDLYDHTEGLKRGTIFRVLDKPFTGKGGRYNG